MTFLASLEACPKCYDRPCTCINNEWLCEVDRQDIPPSHRDDCEHCGGNFCHGYREYHEDDCILNPENRKCWGAKRVLVCGSRRWTDIGFMRAEMSHLRALIGDFQLIHGGARGADIYSGIIAGEMNLPEPIVDRPDYASYGRYGAPKIRNTTMLDRAPDYVLAFYFGGGGTADTIFKAVNHHRIPIIVYRRDHAEIPT